MLNLALYSATGTSCVNPGVTVEKHDSFDQVGCCRPATLFPLGRVFLRLSVGHALLKPGFPRWIGPAGPKAAEALTKLPVPSFTRRVRQISGRQDSTALDWVNLLDEIEGLGKKEKRELRNHLTLLCQTLLKWSYQREFRCAHWRGTLIMHRQDIDQLFEFSPSLRGYAGDILPRAFRDACK